MTVYERLEKIQDVYVKNAEACKKMALYSAYEILMADANMLGRYIDEMPVAIAGMYAGENE